MGARLEISASMLIFGSMGILVKEIGLSSGEIALGRGVIGVLFLLGVMAVLRKDFSWGAIRRNVLPLVLAGVLLGVNWIFLFEAYKHTAVSKAVLVYYLAPVFIMLMSPFVLKERMTGRKVVCAFVSLTGMVLISGVLGGEAQGASDLRGILSALAAAVLYAGLALTNKFVRGLSGVESTMVQLGVAALVLAPYCLLNGGFGAPVMGMDLFLLVVLGVMHTGVGFWLYFDSVQKLRAETAAVFSYVDPLTAVVLSSLFLGESMGVFQVLGGVMILGATMMNGVGGSRVANDGNFDKEGYRPVVAE